MLSWLRKAFSGIVAGGVNFAYSLLPRTRFNYQREVGSGYGSSVVMGPVKFVQRVFPEAPLRVRRRSDHDDQGADDHAMVRLIRRPNRFYTGIALWRATIAAYVLEGNAYWYKVRNKIGAPVELWWIPQWLIEPKWPEDGSEFISHYQYRPRAGQAPIEIPVSEIVHFRNGLDPRNSRLGMSDLFSVLREVFSDDEASNFVASILRNMGVPGIIVSPKNGTVSKEEAESAERVIDRKFTGDRRGRAIAMRGATEIHQFAWSPAQLEIHSVRDVSEERVCSCIGIPAAVVGFGAGLQQTKVGATMRELVTLAWISGITPMQTSMAADLEGQLLPDFVARPEAWEAYFDRAMVDALQENELERTKRMVMAWRGGLAKRSEGRRELGFAVTTEDEVYVEQVARRTSPQPTETENEDEAIPA